jgi:glycosyltransferase involved in cell wall biosynthesis
MEMNPTQSQIAVIVPAYNASAYIADTINSILRQTRPADEIVVVDDGSTDNTAAFVAGISSKITVLRQKNGGQGSARQHGADATTAGLLMFLDADDILYPSALEKLSAVLQRHPLAALVHCPAEMWSSTGQAPSRMAMLAESGGDDLWNAMLHGSFIRTPGCVLLRRTALNEIGGWDADIKLIGNEDWDFWLRLAESHSFARIGEPLLKYRLHDTGFSRSRLKMFKSMFAMLEKHRIRWKHEVGRRRVVEAVAWHSCKYASRELWSGARSEWSKLHVLSATRLVCAMIQISVHPLLTQIVNSVPRRMFRWCRMLCGQEKRSHAADQLR